MEANEKSVGLWSVFHAHGYIEINRHISIDSTPHVSTEQLTISERVHVCRIEGCTREFTGKFTLGEVISLEES